jgi:hypothetical protein
LALFLGAFGAGVSAQSDGMSEGIVSSVVKAPIIANGDAAGAPTDIVINFDTDMDPSVEGRTLLAGNTVRITVPEAFESAGLPADVPTACATFEGECNTGGFLQGWPQRPLPLTAEFYTVELDGTHSMVFTAVQDLGLGATPGIKQMHLFLLGFTNPEAGDYPVEVEAETGPDGELETGTAVRPSTRRSGRASTSRASSPRMTRMPPMATPSTSRQRPARRRHSHGTSFSGVAMATASSEPSSSRTVTQAATSSWVIRSSVRSASKPLMERPARPSLVGHR